MICNQIPTDRCHIKTHGSGGPMAEWNIIRMCRMHHIESHKIGFKKMCVKYPWLEKILNDKGWEFVNEFGITKLRRK